MDCWASSGPIGTSDQGSELPIGALVVHSGPFFLMFFIHPFISNVSIIQMARDRSDRRGKQRETIPEIESDPSSDSKETHDARPPVQKKRERQWLLRFPSVLRAVGGLRLKRVPLDLA